MDVIWLLHGDVLSKIRRALRSPTIKGSKYNVATHGQRVPLIAFVCEVYRACLDNDQGPGFAGCHHQARQLVESICNLFDLVDIDDTGVIDWVDFTDFCVHMRGGYQDGLEDGGGADRSDGCGALAGKSDKDSNITHFAERLGFVDRCSHSHEVRCSLVNTATTVTDVSLCMSMRVLFTSGGVARRPQVLVICRSPYHDTVSSISTVAFRYPPRPLPHSDSQYALCEGASALTCDRGRVCTKGVQDRSP